jgi:hypothetical protein
MSFLHSIWLLLALPLAVSLFFWRLPSRTLLVLRGAVMLLILLALAGLALQLPSRAGMVVVVADRSLSMPPESDGSQREAIDIMQGLMGQNDRLAVVSFGMKAAVEHVPEVGKFAGFVHEVGRGASNLADGVDAALALIPRDGPGRILVLSDGLWTGRDPAAAAAPAANRGIAIDYRSLQRPTTNDVAIARVDIPNSVGPRESFLIHAWVYSPISQEVAYDLVRGNVSLASGTRQVGSGLTRITFRDRAEDPGTQAYELKVFGKGKDPVPENNTARLLVGVRGPRPILLVSSSESSGLPKLLQGGGLKVNMVSPASCKWTIEELSRYSAVLLENLPAEQIGTAGMETLAIWVQQTGSGLMMTGGRASYGPGGYFRSPLEPIMPVSMELRQEHRKLALAIVVALDRSGSMAMPVGGGKVKMDLANLGTVQVLDLLSNMDEFGVIAIDSAPHIIQNLGLVTDKAAVRSKILRINSEGGGIFIYEALEAAHAMIQSARPATKHIILFSDAADAEEPKNYQDILDKCRRQGITVSVIGLGKETDKDGQLLIDIAKKGNGRVFFSDRPEDLPRLFAQDTFVVARSSFLDETTKVRTTPGLQALTGKDYAVPTIGGYNLCYVRPGANLAGLSVDEYKAPIIAAWQAGSGRTLCYTGEADGAFTGAIGKWKDAGSFFTSLARWTAGGSDNLPGNMLLTQDIKKGIARVQLQLDPERKKDGFAGLPEINILRAAQGEKPAVERSRLHWLSSDTLSADIPLNGNETALATVTVPGHGPVSLSPVCLPYSPEFEPPQEGSGLAALEHLARSTGGQERIDLSGIWREIPRYSRMIEIGPWLLLAAVLLLLLEVLERRTGLVAGWSMRLRLRRATTPVERKPQKRRAAVAPPETPRRSETDKASSRPAMEVPIEVPPAPESEGDVQTSAGGLLDALNELQKRNRGAGRRP